MPEVRPVAPGRGAGGHCFPKDLQAFVDHFMEVAEAEEHRAAHAFMTAFRNYNNHLLTSTGKDLDLLSAIYGDEIPTAE